VTAWIGQSVASIMERWFVTQSRMALCDHIA
jgi:hypothetical protein